VSVGERPADRVRAAVTRFGRREVALRCADLLLGGDDVELLPYLGGAHARALLAGGAVDYGAVDYWARVWGARGLRYAWDAAAAPAVVQALTDPAWRVREMAAKVALLREVGEAADALAALGGDPVPRVRAAAARALAAVGEAEHAPALHALVDDPEPEVRLRAGQALERLSERLDRDLRLP
jgi:hypothetical protein